MYYYRQKEHCMNKFILALILLVAASLSFAQTNTQPPVLPQQAPADLLPEDPNAPSGDNPYASRTGLTKVVVLPFESNNLYDEEKDKLTALFKEGLLLFRSFEILDQSQIDQALAAVNMDEITPKQKQALMNYNISKTCSNDDCIIQLGQLLKVELVITGHVLRAGSNIYKVNLQVMDSERRAITFRYTDELIGEVDDIGKNIFPIACERIQDYNSRRVKVVKKIEVPKENLMNEEELRSWHLVPEGGVGFAFRISKIEFETGIFTKNEQYLFTPCLIGEFGRLKYNRLSMKLRNITDFHSAKAVNASPVNADFKLFLLTNTLDLTAEFKLPKAAFSLYANSGAGFYSATASFLPKGSLTSAKKSGSGALFEFGFGITGQAFKARSGKMAIPIYVTGGLNWVMLNIPDIRNNSSAQSTYDMTLSRFPTVFISATLGFRKWSDTDDRAAKAVKEKIKAEKERKREAQEKRENAIDEKLKREADEQADTDAGGSPTEDTEAPMEDAPADAAAEESDTEEPAAPEEAPAEAVE